MERAAIKIMLTQQLKLHLIYHSHMNAAITATFAIIFTNDTINRSIKIFPIKDSFNLDVNMCACICVMCMCKCSCLTVYAQVSEILFQAPVTRATNLMLTERK